jgi:hypothetical protein
MRVVVVLGLGALLCGAALPASEADFAGRMIELHNGERSRVGTDPLVWSDRLARDAQRWADHLAATNSFDHDAHTAQGENLWMGTRASYKYDEMVDAWIEEKSMYKPGRFPDVTRTRSWQDVGHYTQLIWATTTHVGCAIGRNSSDDFLVCRYGPPGNWVGENPVLTRNKLVAELSR